ncbi:hypothetical protein ACSSS7_004004 [Eimeria intestinalis]
MQQEAARMQQQQGQQQSRSFVPPLARLAALDGVPASAVLDAQQQKQLQHELQQLLMQRLAAAQREGRAVAPAKDAASEAVDREETLAELHRRLRDTASSSLLSRVSTLLLSEEQQPLQRPQAILQVLLHLSAAAEQQRHHQSRRQEAAATAARPSPRRPPPHAATAGAATTAATTATGVAAAAEQEAATSAPTARANATSAPVRRGEPREGAEAAPDNLALSLSHSGPPAVRRLRPPAAPAAQAPPGLPYGEAAAAAVAVAAAAAISAYLWTLPFPLFINGCCCRSQIFGASMRYDHSCCCAVSCCAAAAAAAAAGTAAALPLLQLAAVSLLLLAAVSLLLFVATALAAVEWLSQHLFVHASASVQGLVARIGSLGALYLRVQAAVENHSASLLETRSLTAEAFYQSVTYTSTAGAATAAATAATATAATATAAAAAAAVAAEAVLSEEAVAHEAAGAPGASGGSAVSGGTATLRRLAVWLQEPYQRMRLLASLGGALLSTIYGNRLLLPLPTEQALIALFAAAAFTARWEKRNCVPSLLIFDSTKSLKPTLNRKVAPEAAVGLQQSLQPLADSIEAWTRYGELRDDAGEFFVREAPQDLQLSSWCSRSVTVCAAAATAAGAAAGTAAAGACYLTEILLSRSFGRGVHRFVLVPHQIPSFMPPQLPERLLLAGKSLLYSQLLEKPFKPEDSQPSHRKAQLRELPLTLHELLTAEEQQQLLQSPQQQQQQQLLVLPHTQQQLHKGEMWLQHGQQQAFASQQQHERHKTLRLSRDPELPLLQKIEERVAAAAATGNQRLVALLLWDHQLLTHLEAIRRFVLLGDANFTSMLLDAAMQQPQQQQQHAGSMSLQPLILSAIDTAARQCSSGATLFAACPALAFALTARFPHTSYLQQQHQQPQPDRSGTSSSSSSSTCSYLWRGLVLHLRIDGPLRFFIGEGLIKRCHKLFAALWKAHLTHRQLQAACLRGNSLQKQLRQQQRAAAAAAAAAERKAAGATAGRNLVSRATAAAREELLILHVSQICHLLNEMLHFSWQWLHFAHQEVISPNWRLFYQSVPRSAAAAATAATAPSKRLLVVIANASSSGQLGTCDGLFLYDTQEAVGAASGSSSSSSQMQDNCSSMASRAVSEQLLSAAAYPPDAAIAAGAAAAVAAAAEFRFAAAAEQQLLVPPEERGSSSSSMLAVEEQRQAFRRQMLQLLQLLESKQSKVRAAAAAAQAISGSGSSSRSRMHLDHCMAIRSLRTRLDYNDFYEHQRQMLAVTAAASSDTSTSRFPSLLLQQQHAVAASSSSSSSSRSSSRFDKRADGFTTTAHHGSNNSNDETSATGAGGPAFLSKLQQHLHQQLQQQQIADEATRPPTACEASAPPSPLLPQGLRNPATAASANRLLGRI